MEDDKKYLYMSEPQPTNLISADAPPPDNRRFRSLIKTVGEHTLWPKGVVAEDLFLPPRMRREALAQGAPSITKDTEEAWQLQSMMLAGAGTIESTRGLPKMSKTPKIPKWKWKEEGWHQGHSEHINLPEHHVVQDMSSLDFADKPAESLMSGGQHFILEMEKWYKSFQETGKPGKIAFPQSYKRWVKPKLDRRLVNEAGEHINVYHGRKSRNPIEGGSFYNVDTFPDEWIGGKAMDMVLGAHLSNDPAIAGSFPIQAHQFNTVASKGEWGKFPSLDAAIKTDPAATAGGGGYIVPSKLNVSNPREIYQPTWGEVLEGQARWGGAADMTIDVQKQGHLKAIWDQGSVVNDMWAVAGKKNPKVWNLWLENNIHLRKMKKVETDEGTHIFYDMLEDLDSKMELYSLLRRDKPVPKSLFEKLGIEFHGPEGFQRIASGDTKVKRFVPEGARVYASLMERNPYTEMEFVGTFEDFIRLYDTHGVGYGATLPNKEKRMIVRAYRDALEKQGYDAVVYSNTSPGEAGLAADDTCWIVWNPNQIKLPWSGFSRTSNDFFRGIAATATAGAAAASQRKK